MIATKNSSLYAILLLACTLASARNTHAQQAGTDADAGLPLPAEASPNAPVHTAGEMGEPTSPPPTATDKQPAPSRPWATETAHASAADAANADEDNVINVSVVRTPVARTAGSAHVLSPTQLERFEYDDAQAALLQVPGVYVRQEDGLGLRPNISLRGANPDRSKKVALLEDGILFGPAPYSAPAAYYFPLLTRMSHIRVIKGPAAVTYGPQTVGGAIDMVTRAIPSSPAAELDLGFGEFGYGKVHGHFGTSDTQSGLLVEGVHLTTDGFKELDGGGDTGFTRNEWMVKLSHQLDPSAASAHTFSLKLGYADEVSNETYLGLTDSDFRDAPNRRYAASALDRMSNHRTQIALSHAFQLSDLVELRSTLYRHDFARTWRKFNGLRGGVIADVLANPQSATHAELYSVLAGRSDSVGGVDTLVIGPNERAFISQGVQTVMSADARTGAVAHRIEAGLRLHYDQIIRRHSQSGYLMVDGELFRDDNAAEVTTANEASTIALAAHVVDTISWGDLSITPGFRLEVITSRLRNEMTSTETSSGAQPVLLPGLGIYYELIRNLGVLAGAYRGFSPAEAGAPDSEPEHSINYEAGARYSTRRTRVEAIGFFNDYQNLTNICTFSSGCLDDAVDSQTSAGSANIYGLEFYLSHTQRLGPFSIPLSASYTFTRAVFRDSFSSSDPIFGDVTSGDSVPYVPRHQANLTLGVEHAVAKLNLSATYIGAMRETTSRGPFSSVLATDPLWTLDLSASVRLYQDLRLYGNVRNTLNERAIIARRPFGARPNAPRWVQVGIKGEL